MRCGISRTGGGRDIEIMGAREEYPQRQAPEINAKQRFEKKKEKRRAEGRTENMKRGRRRGGRAYV